MDNLKRISMEIRELNLNLDKLEDELEQELEKIPISTLEEIQKAREIARVVPSNCVTKTLFFYKLIQLEKKMRGEDVG